MGRQETIATDEEWHGCTDGDTNSESGMTHEKRTTSGSIVIVASVSRVSSRSMLLVSSKLLLVVSAPRIVSRILSNL